MNRIHINKKIYVTLIIIILILIAGLRASNIGIDTEAYKNLFNSIEYMNKETFINIYYEKGFLIYSIIIHHFTSNFQIYLLIISISILLSVGRYIYINSNCTWLSLFLFITSMYFYNSMNIMRQYLAMGIILLAYECVKKRRKIKFLIMIFCATIFHSSAIIASIMYLVPIIKLNMRKVILIILGSIGAFIFLPTVINKVIMKMPQYTDHIDYMNSMNIANVFKFLLIIGVVIMGNMLIKKRGDKNLNIIMIIATIISFLAIRMSILERIGDYFSIFIIIYIPNIIAKIEDKNTKNLMIYCTIILFLMYNFIIFRFRPEWYGVTPYRFFFNM